MVGRVGEYEDISIETIQSELQTEKKILNKIEPQGPVWLSIYVITDPEERRKRTMQNKKLKK